MKRKYLDSLRAFVRLVIDNHVKEDGGVANGLRSTCDGPRWCSTAAFGSLLYLPAVETRDVKCRNVAERAFRWTIAHDFRKATRIGFQENPARAACYTFEFHAAAMTLVKPGTGEQETAMAEVAAAAQSCAENQQGRCAKSSLNYVGDATCMGGMPYLMYSLARQLPQQRDLAIEADGELRHLAGLLLKNGEPPLSNNDTWELMAWTMVSYAEKFSPGSLYRFRKDSYRINVTVTSPLPKGIAPWDPDIDCGAMIRNLGGVGVLDPNSVEVINQATGQPVPFARSEDFASGDRGRLEWVVTYPAYVDWDGDGLPGPHPWAGDLDGDGLPDLVPGVEWSVCPFYSHHALEMPQRPDVRLER